MLKAAIATSSPSHMLSCSIKLLTIFLCFCHSWICLARDTLTINNSLKDGKQGGGTLISAGERFELGFFTPSGRDGIDRYLGIWYYGSRLVVWVANRDTAIMNSSGIFAIADGNLKILGARKECLWSAEGVDTTSSSNWTLKLWDTGNLVLSSEDENQGSPKPKILWQSFEHPTDTFLPGMNLRGTLSLTSWASPADPKRGNFTFQRDQGDPEETKVFIQNGSQKCWISGVQENSDSSDGGLNLLFYLLSNFSTSSIARNEADYPGKGAPKQIVYGNITNSTINYKNLRLVLKSDGELQLLLRDGKNATWNVRWREPRDRCCACQSCGNYATCNSNRGLYCRCLPGYEPVSLDSWDSWVFQEGCQKTQPICPHGSKSHSVTNFLHLKIMTLGQTHRKEFKSNEAECKEECLQSCDCLAYSYKKVEKRNEDTCLIFSELPGMQEQFSGGRELNVRVNLSFIEPIEKGCGPCGTIMIPYPLSTGKNCGEPMYSNFLCDLDSGELFFMASNRTYTVTNINQTSRTFSIHWDTDCRSNASVVSILHLSLPFNVTEKCQYYSRTNLFEVEIGWEPPPEPTCTSFSDCKDWPGSACNLATDGKKRCLCPRGSNWNGSALKCHHPGENQHIVKKQRPFYPIILSVLATLLIIACAVVYYLKRRSAGTRQEIGVENLAFRFYDSERRVKDFIDSGQFKEEERKDIDVPFIDLECILAATDNFSGANKLGQGGFGPVYKGTFLGGHEIAVKRLSCGSGQGLDEFKNEVVLIAKLQHRNLVRLLGYCIEGPEKMLIYEYMPNKSLDSFIFDRSQSVLLNWNQRFDIIMGIARGLLYLHHDSRLRIIHRDLKLSNVLLDEEMTPKISDFGLARIFGGKQTEASTERVVGTYGYMSPEYALDGLFSIKSDAFSFGVVVLEILSGQKNTQIFNSEEAFLLLGHVWRLWKEERAVDLMDEVMRDSCNADEFVRCANVALLCVQEDPRDRPTMSTVVFMLGSETATLPSPKEPAFVGRRYLSSTPTASSWSQVESNDVTNTGSSS